MAVKSKKELIVAAIGKVLDTKGWGIFEEQYEESSSCVSCNYYLDDVDFKYCPICGHKKAGLKPIISKETINLLYKAYLAGKKQDTALLDKPKVSRKRRKI